ncbi:uncharacterized protein LOC135498127 [Lineus longissimus]|uniref:uncharacterized protein LOC135498127 n=1 Tax=Lineus longissimus TaxID=88925 RepID=UPI002B4C6F64
MFNGRYLWLVLLLFFISSTNADRVCVFPSKMRGTWLTSLIPGGQAYMTVLMDKVSFDVGGMFHLEMSCEEQDTDTYLLRAKGLFALNLDALFCIRFMEHARNQEQEVYTLLRVNGERNQFLEQLKLVAPSTKAAIHKDCQGLKSKGVTELISRNLATPIPKIEPTMAGEMKNNQETP